MAEELKLADFLRGWIGETKDEKERLQRLARAEAILQESSKEAKLTLQQPSVEQTRQMRDLELDFQGKADVLANSRAAGQLERYKDATDHLQRVGVGSYAGKAKVAADQSLRLLQPGYDELKAGREMNSADYRYMLDKEYADRDASRAQQRRGDIFNMIKTLGLGGAILLSK